MNEHNFTISDILNAFTAVCELVPDRTADGAVITYLPQARYPQAATTPLHTYGRGPFCRFQIPASLTGEGVYIISCDEKPLYVGLCQNLADRFNRGYGLISPRNCYRGGQSTNCKINSYVLRETQVGRLLRLLFMSTTRKATVERKLIAHLRPPWNGRQ